MGAVVRRVTILVAATGAGVLAAGMVVAGAGQAAAAPTVLYAAVTTSGTGNCLAVADACTLSTALGKVAAGGTIKLVTPGGPTAASRYVGNWTVGTAGTSARAPVTIEAAAGLASQPILDGNKGAGSGCSTPSCQGSVLTVPSGEHVALSAITIADGTNGTTLTGGGLHNTGTVTITGCMFIGNDADYGGAIESGDNGGGSVTVTASTFSDNTAVAGGAIASGLFTGGGGSVRVTASTFTGNLASDGGAINSGETGGGSVTVTASTFTGNTAAAGGAIDSGDAGGGSVTVTASTFAGNAASMLGGAIDSGDSGGGGSVTVAGDVFDDSCARPGGLWTDAGHNAGSDGTCFNSGTGDVNALSSAALKLGPLAGNGGPTKTIKPLTGSPVIKLIRDPTTITLGSRRVVLCPATDQRGYASASGTRCDAGAVQTSGSPPWPLVVTGIRRPREHAAEGYYLGVKGGRWSLIVTHPGTGNVVFAGRVTLNAGAFRNLTLIDHGSGDNAHARHKTLTFRFSNNGDLDGVMFTTTTADTTITFTLTINGHPATAHQIRLGGKLTPARHRSPLTFRR